VEDSLDIKIKSDNSKTNELAGLIKLIEALRGEKGCPWDKKQTPRTIALYLLEEVYELFDEIQSGKPDEICEELGDVLFQILFVARLYEEMGHFDILDVARRNTAKMIRRHPHVFGSETVDSADSVKQKWHQIKMTEKNLDQKASVLDSVPSGLPALMRAYRISERVARTGFDWDDMSGVMDKLREEWSELNTAMKDEDGDGDKVALEFGDVLFTLVNVARFANIHPETALLDSTKKFEKRFKHMEKIISDSGRTISSVSRNEKERLWEEAKQFY
jgi:MazG family protein